nr:MAG TPA: hypothetical protein [Caudoviricetes sp.]
MKPSPCSQFPEPHRPQRNAETRTRRPPPNTRLSAPEAGAHEPAPGKPEHAGPCAESTEWPQPAPDARARSPIPRPVSRRALALAHSAEQKRGQSRLRLDKSRSL